MPIDKDKAEQAVKDRVEKVRSRAFPVFVFACIVAVVVALFIFGDLASFIFGRG